MRVDKTSSIISYDMKIDDATQVSEIQSVRQCSLSHQQSKTMFETITI